MDLSIIEENIRILEESNTTVETVQELSSLYTVYNNLKYKQNPKKSSLQELNDIMPAYDKYCEDRKQSQLGYTNDDAVLHSLKLLCKELQEFIETLYSNTASRKERLAILYLIKELNDKFNR